MEVLEKKENNPWDILKNISFSDVYEAILKMLSSKERKVLILRYGFEGKPQSLREVGKAVGLSFERVRQIEKKIKRMINKNKESQPFASALSWLLEFFKEKKGVVLEKELLSQNFPEKEKNILKILLFSFDNFFYINKNDKFFEGWNNLGVNLDRLTSILWEVISVLKSKKRPLSLNQIYQHLKKTGIIQEGDNLLPENLESLLAFFKEARKTIDGLYGLVEWPEVKPRNIGDKIYLVLKKYKKPAHYLKIKSLIEAAHFDNKKINTQAIHNELVKDDRFVLVGRGIYALAEWGFKKGTVADVIREILKKEKRPMSKEEIIERVLKERKVSRQTILINLYEKPEFVPAGKGFYILKE